MRLFFLLTFAAALGAATGAGAQGSDNGIVHGLNHGSLNHADMDHAEKDHAEKDHGDREPGGPKHGGAPRQALAITRQIVVPPGASGVMLPDLGVEIVGIRLSAAGNMLDLRYRVLDPVKAKPLLDPAVPFSLIDQTTRAELRIPFDEQVGSLRQSGSAIRPGQVLAGLFANPGRAVKKGGMITIRLGDLEVMGLMVEG